MVPRMVCTLMKFYSMMILAFALPTLSTIGSASTNNHNLISNKLSEWKKCGQGYCVCRNYSAQCHKKQRQLKFIPKINETITYLSFNYNHLPNVTSKTFSNISDLELVSLSLIDNEIVEISENAFGQLNYIDELDLSKNKRLNITMALESLANSTITRIDLNDIGLKVLPHYNFNKFENTQLNSISLAGNRFVVFDCSTISGMKNLTHLKLSRNKILYISMRGVINLRILDLSFNNLQHPPNFCGADNASLLPMLHNLNLKRNRLSSLDNRSFLCLPQIRSIDIQSNTLLFLGNNIVSSLPFLEKLDLSSISPENNIIVEDFALNSSSLRNLVMEFNFLRMWKCDQAYLFKNCQNVRQLDLNGGGLPYIEITFAPLQKLEELDLMLIDITEIPENLFKTLPALEYVDLSGNYISRWNGPVLFGNSSSLRRLDLTDNKISVINETSFPLIMRSNLTHLDLSGNPFSCTCENLWFRNWMKSSDIKFIGRKDYQCAFPTKMKKENRKLDDYNPTIDDCTEINYVLRITVPVLFVLILGVVSSILLYKFRWHIRYKIYLIRKKGYKRLERNTHFQYDGFVIYSDDDRKWVHEILLTYLEKKEGFHLCIRLRDFDVGKVFVENIVENMELSRNILFILSNNFTKDEWCRFQLLLAYHRLIESDNDNVILIMKENIRSENLSSSLITLLSTNSYITWSEEEVALKLFWEQVVAYLRLN